MDPVLLVKQVLQLFMVDFVRIVSMHGLTIEAIYGHQPNTEYFNYKDGCGICECIHIEAFKKALAWVTGKQLWVISNIMLFKAIIPLRN